LVYLGGGERRGVIGRLRRVLDAALPRRGGHSARERRGSRVDERPGERREFPRRIDAARRRLKETIPPPEDYDPVTTED
jgi:hypothetical protein